MKVLSLSLALTVLMSIYGVGLGLNWLYDTFNGEEGRNHQSDQPFPQYIARLLNEADDLALAIDLWGDESGALLFLEETSALVLPNELDEKFKAGEAVVLESSTHLIHHYYLSRHDTILSIELPHPDLESGKRLNLLFTLGFYLGVLALVAFWLFPLVRRLQQLNTSANLFGKGDFDTRIPVSNMSYINHIERAFNMMASKISNLLDDNKILSRAVSHDLKTPLARLRFGIDMLMESVDDEQREQCYQKIDADLDVMQALIDALLDYAKLDSNSISLKKEVVHMESYIKELLSVFSHKSEYLGNRVITLSEFSEDVFMAIDKAYFSMVVNNLIVNALRYSKKKIVVSLKKDQEFYVVSVDDDGPGIPVDQRQRLLKPFQRGDGGQSGHGLGLAICKKIISWHGGDLIIADSHCLGGASFICRMPRISN